MGAQAGHSPWVQCVCEHLCVSGGTCVCVCVCGRGSGGHLGHDPEGSGLPEDSKQGCQPPEVRCREGTADQGGFVRDAGVRTGGVGAQGGDTLERPALGLTQQGGGGGGEGEGWKATPGSGLTNEWLQMDRGAAHSRPVRAPASAGG